MRSVLIPVMLVLSGTVFAGEKVEIPAWVMHGILSVETRSYYDESDIIQYVDMRRGKAGEQRSSGYKRGVEGKFGKATLVKLS